MSIFDGILPENPAEQAIREKKKENRHAEGKRGTRMHALWRITPLLYPSGPRDHDNMGRMRVGNESINPLFPSYVRLG